MSLEEKARNLPDLPGVYVMKNAAGQVIYVGKARSLKHRVRSYFQKGPELKTRAMVARLADFDYIITNSEIEALILENNLIKEHRPRYNVVLRDDKNYPCLKLTVEEKFPRLYIVRQIKKDNSVYFGPFTSAQALRDTLRMVYKVFGLRRCPPAVLKKGRPCIYCQMKQCLAPCAENINAEEYRKVVERIKDFFQGKGHDSVLKLRKEMNQEAERLNFEKAAILRDYIRSLEKVLTKQRIVSTNFLDQDFVGLHLEDGLAQVELLFVRAGKLIGNQSSSLSNRRGFSEAEITSSFLKQFYSKEKFLPQEIIIGSRIEDAGAIETWLSARKGTLVKLIVPQKGDRAKILKMAVNNAVNSAKVRLRSEKYGQNLMTTLRTKLRLQNLPSRVEAYDISNIQGATPVGSLVVFQDGQPHKSGYRHYKIRTVGAPNDYLMMHEMLTRRFTRALQEKEKLPDLVLIDGGKGQLATGLKVLEELKIEGVDIIGLAKGEEEKEEKIYLPNIKEPIKLGSSSPLLFLLQRIRDEAHRFAITFHRKLRKKGALRSALEDIPGIGPAKRKSLLSHLGSLKQVMEASLEQIASVEKISPKDAQTIYNYLHQG